LMLSCPKCGREYTTQKRLDNHLARCTVGDTPTTPAPFVPPKGGGGQSDHYASLYRTLLLGVASILKMLPGKADYAQVIEINAPAASVAVGNYASQNAEFAKALEAFSGGFMAIMVSHLPMVIGMTSVYGRHVAEGKKEKEAETPEVPYTRIAPEEQGVPVELGEL